MVTCLETEKRLTEFLEQHGRVAKGSGVWYFEYGMNLAALTEEEARKADGHWIVTPKDNSETLAYLELNPDDSDDYIGFMVDDMNNIYNEPCELDWLT